MIPTNEPEHIRWHKLKEVESKTAELISNGYTFEYNSNYYTFDTSSDSLSKLSVAYSVAKQYRENNLPYSQPMVMRDYQVVTMDRDSIISTYEAMIAFGLQLYSQHASIIQQLNIMTYEELMAWTDSRN